MIRDANAAEDQADAAEAAAVSATTAWASSGASADVASGDRALLDKAAEANRRALDARLMVEGAKKGVGAVEEAAMDARAQVDNAGLEIKAAIAAVMLSEVEPKFLALERAYQQYSDSLAEIRALPLVVRAGGPSHPFFEFASGTAAETIEQRLRQLEIKGPLDTDLRERAKVWITFAQRLVVDPGAEFE